VSTPPLILASGSRYRRELLRRLGVEFEAISADVDESRRPGEAPLDLARRLASAKAEAVRREHPEAFVIGSDQIIALGDEVFTKPGSAERACGQLARLAGREHLLATAVCVVSPDGRVAESVTSFAMKMRELDEDQISRYVAEDEPLDCAGSYRIEAGGIRLFEYLRGDDYTAIVGLPLTRVRAHLEQLGFFGEQ
jgi:septum formation protein